MISALFSSQVAGLGINAKTYTASVDGKVYLIEIETEGSMEIKTPKGEFRLEMVGDQPILERRNLFGVTRIIPNLNGLDDQKDQFDQTLQSFFAQHDIRVRQANGRKADLPLKNHAKSCAGAVAGLIGAGILVGTSCSGPQATAGACVGAMMVYLAASDNYWEQC